MGYLYLVLAIVAEVLGTNLLKASQGFSKLLPTLLTLLIYFFCFYFLARAMKSIQLNVAYALWGGLGIVLTTVIAVFVWKEPLTWPAILGIALILSGTFVLNFFGNAAH